MPNFVLLKQNTTLNFDLTWKNEYLNLTGYHLHRNNVRQFF